MQLFVNLIELVKNKGTYNFLAGLSQSRRTSKRSNVSSHGCNPWNVTRSESSLKGLSSLKGTNVNHKPDYESSARKCTDQVSR